jgi:hypothetical protein
MAHPAPAPAHPHRHTTQRPDGYARRRPEETVLYQTIAEHWHNFRERLSEHGGLPRFVEREFEAYLRCGILDFGFLELECRQCGHTELVCGGPMRWVEAATGAEAISRLLAKHGLAPRPPPPSRTPPSSDGQLSFAFARSSR